MKYLINKETKEHRIDRCPEALPAEDWYRIQADSDGWIAHTGDKCPLPDDVRCDLKFDNGKLSTVAIASHWGWGNSFITHYRPVLTEKVQEPDYDPRSVSFNLLDRLKAAHEHAQQIPDLEKELREVLGSMGYTLGKLSPFVEAEAEPDITDWRNWREGDKVQYFGYTDSFKGSDCFIGAITDELFRIHKAGTEYFTWASPHEIRFHSRPSGE